jgi:lipopolysaccharide assembly outer membrane protein LptD (OstA)
MPRSASLAFALAFLTACGPSHPAATATVSPAATAVAVPTATQLPVRVVTKSSGSEYATMVQTTTDPGSAKSRQLYNVRYRSSVGERTGPTNAVITLDLPHIIFYDRTGKQLVADAPKAKVTQQDKNVYMTGGVHARSQDGTVLTCDRLRYDGRTEKLQGDGHVVMTSPSGPNSLQMTGEHLYGDVRLDHVKVTQ